LFLAVHTQPEAVLEQRLEHLPQLAGDAVTAWCACGINRRLGVDVVVLGHKPSRRTDDLIEPQRARPLGVRRRHQP